MKYRIIKNRLIYILQVQAEDGSWLIHDQGFSKRLLIWEFKRFNKQLDNIKVIEEGEI